MTRLCDHCTATETTEVITEKITDWLTAGSTFITVHHEPWCTRSLYDDRPNRATRRANARRKGRRS